MAMIHFSFFRAATAFSFWLLFLSIPFSAGQKVLAAQTAENTDESDAIEPFTIKLSVNEVRLDVVVLDKKTGSPITDLTASDFEVFQDNKLQEIKSSVYIDSQPDEVVQSAAVRKENSNLSLTPIASIKKEDVRRTILFIVDDYAMSFQNGYYAKMALRNFVEKQMQHGDLVSILRTSYGNSALNMFQSDKREALARINFMSPTMAPSQFDNQTLSGAGLGMWQHFMIKSHENRKATISHGIDVLKNMPGRKILILITPLSVHEEPYALVAENISVMPVYNPNYPTTKIPSASLINADRIRRYEELYHELADKALRAGVVVNLLDVDGLYNLASNYADAERSVGWSTPGSDINSILLLLQAQRSDPIRPTNPLPALTGGISIQDNNFFLDGIGREVESLMRGYYLISYDPPANTFETHGKKDIYRSLKVRVNRKDAVVHTRGGFFGRLESEMDAEIPKQHPLVAAIHSPYQSTDLNVNISAGYVNDAKAGYAVRSWVHLDPKDVKIVETQNGGARID